MVSAARQHDLAFKLHSCFRNLKSCFSHYVDCLISKHLHLCKVILDYYLAFFSHLYDELCLSES